jgi:hypothetical protein
MPFKGGDVTRNLPAKGFVVDASRNHTYLYFYKDGKKTRFYTYVSHGKPGEDVGDDNVRAMKEQLGLGTMAQVRELVACPMDGAKYLSALMQSGKLLPPSPPLGKPPGSARTGKARKVRGR